LVRGVEHPTVNSNDAERAAIKKLLDKLLGIFDIEF
jgi:hypothetical protein